MTCPTAGGGGGVGAAWVRFRSRRDSAAAFECRLLALLAPAADPSPEERRFFFARTARPLLLPHAEPPSSDMDLQDPDPAELGVALRRLRCESASDSQELPALPKLRAMSASHFSLRAQLAVARRAGGTAPTTLGSAATALGHSFALLRCWRRFEIVWGWEQRCGRLFIVAVEQAHQRRPLLSQWWRRHSRRELVKRNNFRHSHRCSDPVVVFVGLLSQFTGCSTSLHFPSSPILTCRSRLTAASKESCFVSSTASLPPERSELGSYDCASSWSALMVRDGSNRIRIA